MPKYHQRQVDNVDKLQNKKFQDKKVTEWKPLREKGEGEKKGMKKKIYEVPYPRRRKKRKTWTCNLLVNSRCLNAADFMTTEDT